jgi:hypothetical protein
MDADSMQSCAVTSHGPDHQVFDGRMLDDINRVSRGGCDFFDGSLDAEF